MTEKNRRSIIVLALGFWLLLAATSSCSDAPPAVGKPGAGAPAIQTVADIDHFKRVLQENGGRLLVFDFYADWCQPCKQLHPILADLAARSGDQAVFYKIDVDRSRDLAGAVGLRGIPYVLFVKNGKTVHAMTGLHPREAYERVIDRYSGVPSAERGGDRPDGEIVDGVRVIRRSTTAQLGTIYVYRGESVNLVIEDIEALYAVHIPQYGISSEAPAGGNLEVRFKAADVGVFPIFCNGDCPEGDGTRFGQIVVMPFAASGEADYTELSAEAAMELIRSRAPLILDVRTPGEFYEGHIEGARLIPVQQLQARVSEIADHRGREVFIYCRSGNRSTVAAEILMHEGFAKLYNLRHGVIEWRQKGYDLVR